MSKNNPTDTDFPKCFSSSVSVVKWELVKDKGYRNYTYYRLYRRGVNQNTTYFLMSNDKIIHVGKRKHITAMWNRYTSQQAQA